MRNQRVSVVVTTHNSDNMLAESLESLMTQTLPLHEVVVVDDDGSARGLVERFGSRFRYLWQPNGARRSARNHGTRAARGEWIASLDDDDLWQAERHALLAELIWLLPRASTAFAHKSHHAWRRPIGGSCRASARLLWWQVTLRFASPSQSKTCRWLWPPRPLPSWGQCKASPARSLFVGSVCPLHKRND